MVGIHLTCERYVDFFGSLIDIFNDGSFPRIDSLMMAISLATKNQLIDHFTKTYEEMVKCELELVLDPGKPRGRNTILVSIVSIEVAIQRLTNCFPLFSSGCFPKCSERCSRNVRKSSQIFHSRRV